MSSFDSELHEIHPKTPAGWRSWLQKNHTTSDGVWLIYYRASTGSRRLTWEEAVREALCFGWIDSKAKSIDDERYKQIFTPRKPKSVWSKINKQHIAELTELGLMSDAGLRAVDVAKKNGALPVVFGQTRRDAGEAPVRCTCRARGRVAESHGQLTGLSPYSFDRASGAQTLGRNSSSASVEGGAAASTPPPSQSSTLRGRCALL